MGQPAPASIRATLRPHPPEHAIPCPVPGCAVPAGIPCRTPKRRPLTAGSHPSRLDAWLVQQHGPTAA